MELQTALNMQKEAVQQTQEEVMAVIPRWSTKDIQKEHLPGKLNHAIDRSEMSHGFHQFFEKG